MCKLRKGVMCEVCHCEGGVLVCAHGVVSPSLQQGPGSARESVGAQCAGSDARGCTCRGLTGSLCPPGRALEAWSGWTCTTSTEVAGGHSVVASAGVQVPLYLQGPNEKPCEPSGTRALEARPGLHHDQIKDC